MASEVDALVAKLRARGLTKPNYQVQGDLGKGKFAVVHKVELDGNLFALKRIRIFGNMPEATRIKCLKEVELLSRLEHPNIIRYEDGYLDPDTDELVIVLQWARGGDLKKLIRKLKSSDPPRAFSERQVLQYLIEMSEAMKYLHEHRILHRDLKPANILLSSDNHVLLADLGLSRWMSEQTMEAFSKVGTPLYIAPGASIGNSA